MWINGKLALAHTSDNVRPTRQDPVHWQFVVSSSSRMHVMNHNWSATKQCLHPQSVSEISRRSVLSGDRSRQCGTLVLGDGGCYFCNTTKSCGASDENKVIRIAKCDVFSGVCESIR